MYAFTTTDNDEVRFFRERQATDRGRRLEPLTGFSGCEIGAFRPASEEVSGTGVCGVFDTKRGTLISWCIDQHTFRKWSSYQVTMVRLRSLYL